MTPVFLLPAFSPPAGGGQSNPIFSLIPILLVFLIFYALIIRPQQRKQKDHQKMLEALEKGDQILTTGGMYATILNVKDEKIVATISEGVKVEFARNAVAARVKAKKA